jgi:hypothetical protein
MELMAIIIMIVVTLALIGITAFLIYDYLQYKDDTSMNFAKTSQSVYAEKSERLSNMKYIVDQVNNVNNDIFNTYSSNVATTASNINDLQRKQNGMVAGLGTFLNFTSNQYISGSTNNANLSLLDLPGIPSPDVQLIKHVTILSGMNINELSSSNSAQFCSKSNPSRCIQLPDSNGDIVFRSFDTNKKVVIDSPAEFRDTLSLSTPNTSGVAVPYAKVMSTGGNNPDTIMDTMNNNLQIRAKRMGVSSTPITPNATLNIVSDDSTGDMMRVTNTSLNKDVIIKPDGTLVVPRIQIGTSTNPITLTQSSTGTLDLTAPQGIRVVTNNANAITNFFNPVNIPVLTSNVTVFSP